MLRFQKLIPMAACAALITAASAGFIMMSGGPAFSQTSGSENVGPGHWVGIPSPNQSADPAVNGVDIGNLPFCKNGFEPTPCRMGDPYKPTNDLPQPYRMVSNWGELPFGTWPAVDAVEEAPDGTLYIVERCNENSCEGRKEPPILHEDKEGHLIKAFGVGLFIWPHGVTVDSKGNLWITDARTSRDKRQGDQVWELDSQGNVLKTYGKAGQEGNDSDGLFMQPTGVAVAPDGTIFVADGHNSGRGNNRIVKMSPDGKFIKTWGEETPEEKADFPAHKFLPPGILREPHDIAIAPDGKLWVADRGNDRVDIFDQDGKLLAEWYQFGRPSAIAISKDGNTIYVADSESGPNTQKNEVNGWLKGIRVGSAKTGELTAFIEDAQSSSPLHSGAEGVGVDSEGNVYGSVPRRMQLEKYERKTDKKYVYLFGPFQTRPTPGTIRGGGGE